MLTVPEKAPLLDQFQRVLVTGGSGFIGRHLATALVSLGKQVVALDNLPAGLNRTLPRGATFLEADLRDYPQALRAATDIDLLFHVAGNASATISVEDSRFDFETNTLATFNALEAATACGVKRFLYVSSASVYGTPQRFPVDEEHPVKPFVPYGASKLAGELSSLSFFHAYGLAVVIARPFCVYGPGENPQYAMVEVSRYLRWHLNHRPIQIVGHMDHKTRDFVHINDAIQALLLMADRGGAGSVFNLGSGTEVSMRRLTEIIGSATGRQAEVEEISEVTDDTYRLVADISELTALGYVPEVPLAEGVERLADELGENPDLPSTSTIFKRGQKAER
ncbi:MAG: NAD-dependent epimerase/dehydratase family protein [Candidatus Methylomirabilia bacterium]